MNDERNDEIEIDLKELFFVLLGKIWIIILTTALGLGLAVGVTVGFIKPVYSSTATLYVITKSTSITSLADIQMGTSLTQDYMEFVTSRPVAEKVIQNLELDMTYEAFKESIEVENPSNTRFLNITVRHHDAYMAKKIVDQLTDVSASRMAEIMESQKPNVMDYGHIAEAPVSPSVTKNGLLGAVIGFLLSAGIITVLYLMNDKIHTTEDVEKYLGINTLGLIPLKEGTSKRGTHGHDKDAKAYQKKKKKVAKGKKERR